MTATAKTNDAGIREFAITRSFDAPRAQIWKAWTDPDHMRWWGPKGMTVPHCEMDLRPGGTYHYCLRTPDGHDMWGKWVFREITAPERLVFVNSFSDAEGGLTRHPLSPTWPLEMLSTLTLTEQAGQTTLTLQWIPENATEAERETFAAGHDSMRQGWTGTLDKLAEHLANA